ncbi:EamA family transporter [Myroides phaeus]|uniref:Threonine/homoserine efflux transporter RhtA n=1 Tax=Myroides phaeus TaxID=702745 RepID=A0A1G8F2U2_9FLAO|nr:DMT family transporter [Myroides phaeus]MEC4117737.1 DMT family transporter [Myroides phaeus]SDH76473.1 Threonine/homoserine efflux transporter RhtA [Myroides phaeus]
MKEQNIVKGVFLVAIGASSFGMLASFVKLAYQHGYTTAEVTLSQVVLGLVGMLIINMIRKKQPTDLKPTKKDIKQLMLAGTSMGFTSVLYYMAVSYIDASIAVVLLMQSVWIGVVIESVITKTFPSLLKIVAVCLILFGTVLATNVLANEINLDIRGVIFGFLASCSFATTMFASNVVANHLPAPKRSLFMLCGAFIIVAIFVILTQVGPNNSDAMMGLFKQFSDNTTGIRDFNWNIFYTWGLLLALFGTILPPIFLNMGFPHTGVGLGSIISSLELPVSVSVAFLVLGEQVILIQWVGIILILSAIFLMNSSLIFKSKKVEA